MKKRYLRLAEVATSLNLEPLDLLNYGIEGETPIGILTYDGISVSLQTDSFVVFDNDGESSIAGNTPHWLVILVPKTLREIAVCGKVYSGRGYRWSDDDWEVVEVNSENGMTLNSLVVPIGAVQNLTPTHQLPASAPENKVSKIGKETFQKQIAGLAIVIFKQSKGGQFGKNTPNSSQIAQAVLATIDQLPKDLHATLNLKGVGDTAIRQNISKGLQLLGFSSDDVKS